MSDYAHIINSRLCLGENTKALHELPDGNYLEIDPRAAARERGEPHGLLAIALGIIGVLLLWIAIGLFRAAVG